MTSETTTLTLDGTGFGIWNLDHCPTLTFTYMHVPVCMSIFCFLSFDVTGTTSPPRKS